MGEKEVRHSFGLWLRERLWAVIEAAAGEVGGAFSGPFVPEVSVSIHTNTFWELRVDGASLAPQPVLSAGEFITC